MTTETKKGLWETSESLDNKPLIGFVYPEALVGEQEVFTVWKMLSNDFKKYQVVDFYDIAEPKEESCRACRELVLKKQIFPVLGQCETIYFWTPLNTCFIKCVMHQAWMLKKNLQYISLLPDELEYEDLTLKDYHFVEASTEVG